MNKAISLGVVLLSSVFNFTVAQAKVERPPQFVVMSFDGSKSIERWQTTRQFARDNNLKFTYFISGVYYIGNANKNIYQGPGHAAGRSDIGFGSSSADIQTRIHETLLTQQDGNEIGSHVNGHFDGSKWSLDQWKSEFEQFNHFIKDVFMLNNIVEASAESSWAEAIGKSLKGFRAPLLGYNVDMYTVMQQNGMTFDTSQIWKPDQWPKQRPDTGIWITPLQSLPIVGTAKRTITMDYNFYVTQSGAKNDPANAATYSKQMLDSYMALFQKAYNGNRAPIIIGHHFSNWNGGAYWQAMMSFAKNVCKRPEVRCVTHSQLVSYLEENKANLASYQAGDFDPAPTLNIIPQQQILDLQMLMSQNNSGQVEVSLSGANRNLSQTSELHWSVDGQELPQFRNKYVMDLKSIGVHDSSRLRASLIHNGVEVQATTHEAYVNYNDIKIEDNSLEQRALLGDLPEAHFDENSH